MTTIIANGLEPLDLCLHRNNYPTSMTETVLMDMRNRHLAYFGTILPRNTEITVPIEQPKVKETISLWD